MRPRGAGETSDWLLPPSSNRAPLLSILKTGGVEVQTLSEALTHEGATYPKGTAVVRLDQPFGGFANAVLSVQNYPHLLDESGRPVRPCDVTSHTLPLLLNTPAVAVQGPFEAKTGKAKIDWNPVRVATKPKGKVRLALLKSNTIDEGWARWTLEQNGVPYTLIEPSELGKGDLHARFDALLPPTPLGGGRAGGDAVASQEPTPRESAQKAVRTFVEEGGTVVAINRASNSVIAALDLPVKDVTQGLSRNEFYVPGSILHTELNAASPLTRGLGPTSIVWTESSPAFEVTGPTVEVVAKYPSSANPLLSGWLLGGEKIQGKAALVDARVGKGRAILFGFEPDYRGLSLATYPLLFNAIQASARP